jgi:hypothetical protein
MWLVVRARHRILEENPTPCRDAESVEIWFLLRAECAYRLDCHKKELGRHRACRITYFHLHHRTFVHMSVLEFL